MKYYIVLSFSFAKKVDEQNVLLVYPNVMTRRWSLPFTHGPQLKRFTATISLLRATLVVK